ncbi:phospholipase/carboxylesterase family protein [Candidatus Nitrososphaera gargensis Ga9.2]|uniref:Phospholipase/carboxylesterase family protein n=1 Tax=Nitrososphaera gargensis (strain Ga9.2) TaxID=1237085 RepID=K0IKX9_NITGG|nr:alpha/beta hydrolase [Candidatus Nitrososphaera gargensis]AFU60048.1 phospholipase/carboxylesterase family protein [Candidatus Nitrososphaera gargensis Ga9.2]
MAPPEIPRRLGFVHRYVPPAKGTAARKQTTTTLLLLHGTGGNEDDMLPLGQALDPDAALLSPRGKILEAGMTPRFFRRLAEGVFDIDDLKYRTHELADFVEAASCAYGFDEGNVLAVGYSNGANIAASTLLLRPKTLSGAILFRAMVPLVPDKLPDLSGKRIFMSSGLRDPIVPRQEAEKLSKLFEQSGATIVTLKWQKNAGHELTDDDIQSARQWLLQQH